MQYQFFSHNGELKPIDQASVPLSNIEYSYGFGVYETIRMTNGVILFLPDHCQRLLNSAHTIELEHMLTIDHISEAIKTLIIKNEVSDCNIKVLLIGGRSAEQANLYIQCLNPLYPDRKLYKQGAHAITTELERPFLQAKTLNMLPSYLAYREAQRQGAYDALLIDRNGHVTEGTRTNFYTIKNRTIFTPPESVVLPGVTRDKVLQVARKHGYEITEQNITPAELAGYDGAFLTSTSSKIMPLISIDDHRWETVPAATAELIQHFGDFLNDYNQSA